MSDTKVVQVNHDEKHKAHSPRKVWPANTNEGRWLGLRGKNLVIGITATGELFFSSEAGVGGGSGELKTWKLELSSSFSIHSLSSSSRADFNRFLCFRYAATMGFLLFGYDQGVMAGISESMLSDHHELLLFHVASSLLLFSFPRPFPSSATDLDNFCGVGGFSYLQAI